MGGQTSQQHKMGSVITVANTDEHWNHKPKQSIMRLGRWTKEIQTHDRVSLLLEIRAETAGWIALCGDGGHVNPQQKTGWASSWKDKKLRVEPTGWTTLAISTDVTPTSGSYDPATRGTSVYLITSIGSGKLQYKRIRLMRARARSIEANA
jgi:hypothetical protein